MKRKPIVGETLILWTEPHRRGQEFIESVTVESVGKKYFTLNERYKTRFCLSDWGIEDSWNTRANGPKWIFESIEQLDLHKADLAIKKRFQTWLNSYPKVTVDQARSILAIVDP